ncbi:4'-phosphopantetheinyl transferase superfamily protein [Nisaea sp.]|uniref:4'-phosphopantetheinyl transferase family protein n=1 Tax=Nisaea sp. TaxID=2024842 RepID=UPI003263AA97
MRANEVEIWWLRPDLIVGGHLQSFDLVLNDEERIRARRFHFADDRRSYICAHALTRCALEAVSGISARDFVFRIGRHGKPEVDAEPEQGRLRFNLSHSRGLVCCAVTWELDIGIDVEGDVRDVDVGDLAAQVFAPDEVACLQRFTGRAHREAFFAMWTVKEAYTKAVGRGLSIPLDAFSVCLNPPSLMIGASLSADPEAGDGEGWSVRLARPVPGYTLAVVARGGSSGALRYRFREVTPDALAALCRVRKSPARMPLESHARRFGWSAVGDRLCVWK